MSVNKVILVGSCGNDPKIAKTSSGKEIANFSLATSEKWTDKATGEKKDKTEWHKIVVYSESLTNVIKNYVKKGSKLYIEGQLQTRKWTDKYGVEKYTTEIVLQNFNSRIDLLSSKKEEEQSDAAFDAIDKHLAEKEASFNDLLSQNLRNLQKTLYEKYRNDDIPF